jgi:flagellar biosynthesis/type III secretory pathway protein FliH
MRSLEELQAATRDLAALTRREPPPTWEEFQAARAKLRVNIESLIADMHHLHNSAILVIAEFSTAALAADSWKDLHEHFSRVLLILERIFKRLAEPETDSLLKHAIGVARGIVAQADEEYQRYSQTAYLLGSKANAERLREAIEEADSGTLPVYESAGDFFKSLRGK